jgi:hypothetical protein
LDNSVEFRNKLLQELAEKAAYWRRRRDEDPYTFWECKAKWHLFDEAANIIEKIEYSSEVKIDTFCFKVLDKILEYKDWGWGTNWPNYVHIHAIRFVRDTIITLMPKHIYMRLKPDLVKKEEMLQKRKETKIFISYAKEDYEQAAKLYELLKEKGYTPWIDNKNLFPGYIWDIEIEKAIKDSDIFIACMSNNSVSKEGYFQKELKRALEYLDYKPEGTIYIIPLRFDDCKVPFRFEKIHYCDFFERGGAEKVLTAIETKLGHV